ncbi:hypothetical protein KP509_07G061000, partial [Ceratopteris richardii]
SFHRLSGVEPWDLTADLRSHLQTLYAQSFRITLASPILSRLLAQMWLIILSDQLLIVALMQVPPWADPSFFLCSLWETPRGCFPSDLHVLGIPPAFILSQDQTLHEISSFITYSFFKRRKAE